MDRDFNKFFLNWLEVAKGGDLFAKRDSLYELRKQLKGSEIMPDIRWMIRMIDRELLTRSDLALADAREKARSSAKGQAAKAKPVVTWH
jgi:hypothetical protein